MVKKKKKMLFAVFYVLLLTALAAGFGSGAVMAGGAQIDGLVVDVAGEMIVVEVGMYAEAVAFKNDVYDYLCGTGSYPVIAGFRAGNKYISLGEYAMNFANNNDNMREAVRKTDPLPVTTVAGYQDLLDFDSVAAKPVLQPVTPSEPESPTGPVDTDPGEIDRVTVAAGSAEGSAGRQVSLDIDLKGTAFSPGEIGGVQFDLVIADNQVAAIREEESLSVGDIFDTDDFVISYYTVAETGNSFTASIYIASGNPVEKDGTLCSVVLDLKNSGRADLTIENVKFFNTYGAPMNFRHGEPALKKGVITVR